MSSNSNFSLSSIDPDSLKQSFINFLQSNTTFSDFNFKGPNINVLLDIFARNSFLNSFYINMGYAESQLDSAQLRDSVISQAKTLGYVPSSMISSVAYINITLSSTSGNTFVIPKGTNFSGFNSNNTFNFLTDKDYIQISSNNTFYFNNVAVYEGKLTTESFTVDSTINNQLFKLSNPTIDISSLNLLVSEDKGSTNTYFYKTKNIYGLDGSSKIFYIQATEGNTYQFYFGDGVLGYKPKSGTLVSANYRVTFGDLGNECGTMSLADNLSLYNNTFISDVTVKTIANSFGGSQNEDINSVKFNAPKLYQTQDKAITAPDYRNIILKNYPQVADVHVYGGNVTTNAVSFGSVFISCVSKKGNPLTQSIKDDINSYLQTVGILSLGQSNRFVDANTIWINITSNVHINFNQTNNSPDYYKSLTTNTILGFFTSNLQRFNKSFITSNFISVIDNIDANNIVLGNETFFNIQKNIDTVLGNNNIYFSFNNKIANITSSQFIVNSYTSIVTDNYPNILINKGTVSLLTFDGNNLIYNSTIGTVNYDSGTISIPLLKIDGYIANGLNFISYPNTKIISVENNDIIKLNQSTLVVNTTNG
jgi:hypothetical protein